MSINIYIYILHTCIKASPCFLWSSSLHGLDRVGLAPYASIVARERVEATQRRQGEPESGWSFLRKRRAILEWIEFKKTTLLQICKYVYIYIYIYYTHVYEYMTNLLSRYGHWSGENYDNPSNLRGALFCHLNQNQIISCECITCIFQPTVTSIQTISLCEVMWCLYLQYLFIHISFSDLFGLPYPSVFIGIDWL